MPVTHFVTGHLDISAAEFAQHYVPQLEQAAREVDSEFVMGVAPGVDTMARAWLVAHGVAPARITVYVLARFKEAVDIKDPVNTMGFFPSHAKCDSAMAAASHYCIAWVRPEAETRVIVEARIALGEIPGPYKARESATARNLRRALRTPQRYWHGSETEMRACEWALHDRNLRRCVVVKERRGPGDIRESAACLGCLRANFGYSGAAEPAWT